MESTEHQAPESNTFDSWAVVEVMGHQRLAGHVKEITIAGAGMLRVDIPETKHGPATSKIISPGAIYAITPCSERMARQAATQLARYNEPLSWVDFPKQETPVAIDHDDETEPEDDPGF